MSKKRAAAEVEPTAKKARTPPAEKKTEKDQAISWNAVAFARAAVEKALIPSDQSSVVPCFESDDHLERNWREVHDEKGTVIGVEITNYAIPIDAEWEDLLAKYPGWDDDGLIVIHANPTVDVVFVHATITDEHEEDPEERIVRFVLTANRKQSPRLPKKR